MVAVCGCTPLHSTLSSGVCSLLVLAHDGQLACRAVAARRRLAAGAGIAPTSAPSKGDVLRIRRPGKWWPAPVTLRVPRLKRPRLHFKACRPKWCSRSRRVGTLATLSTSCLCCWTTRAKEMGPPAGDAPASLRAPCSRQSLTR